MKNENGYRKPRTPLWIDFLKALALIVLAIVTLLVSLSACHRGDYGKVEILPEALWCDIISHQDIDCPKFGEVEIPPEVSEKLGAEYVAWCYRLPRPHVIYPQVKLTPADYLRWWCIIVSHWNIYCPRHGKVKVMPGKILVVEYRLGDVTIGCPRREKK